MTAVMRALLFVGFLPAVASANEISYDYLDLNFITTEIESPRNDGEGAVLQA